MLFIFIFLLPAGSSHSIRTGSSGGSLADVPIVSPLDGSSISTGIATSSPPEAMIISNSFPPISGKIAEKIQKGKFIEMKELMPDKVIWHKDMGGGAGSRTTCCSGNRRQQAHLCHGMSSPPPSLP